MRTAIHVWVGVLAASVSFGSVVEVGPVEGNATPAVRAAVDRLGDGDTLRFAKGEYHFFEEGAKELFRASVGSLYISLSGLEKIGQALACGCAADGVRLLSPQAAAEMRADQRTVRGTTVTVESPYGLGMYRFTASDGRTWYGHQGRWQGMLTDLFVEPDTHTAVVLVMNDVDRSSGELDAKAERTLLRVGQWLEGGVADDGPGSFVVDEDLP